MEPLKTHNGIAAVLNRINVDTDQIIPKQFLKRIERTGYGRFAFFDWRYLDNGDPNPDFELNRPEYKGASILIAGENFEYAALQGNTRHGRLTTTDLKSLSRRLLPISFTKTVLKTASCRSAFLMRRGKSLLNSMSINL